MSIVLAVIMKNESDRIETLIESTMEGIDKYVFVDTGSKDDTIHKVSKFCRKPHIIDNQEWKNDFSHARNVSFHLAKQMECTWIMWLDCDDKFSDIKKLVKFLAELPQDVDCVTLPYHYWIDEQGRVRFTHKRDRLYRSHLDLKWSGKVHESINLNGMRIQHLDIPVLHMRSQKELKNEGGRNLAIYEQNSKDLDARDTFYYAKELRHHGRIDEAIEQFKKKLSMGGFVDEIYATHVNLAEIYLERKACNMAYMHASTAITIYDDVPDGYYLLGLILKEYNKPRAAIHMFEICMNLNTNGYRNNRISKYVTPDHTTSYGLGIYHARTHIEPLQQLEQLYYQLGMYNQALNVVDEIKEYCKEFGGNVDHDERLLRDLVGARIPDSRRTGSLKLNIGCGGQKFEGVIGIDKYDRQADVVCSIEELDLPDSSCESITMFHSLEHMDVLEGQYALQKIANLLKPGGKLELDLPELRKCCESFVNNVQYDQMKEWYRKTLYGRQVTDGRIDLGQFHKWGYTEYELRQILEQLGFVITSTKQWDNYSTPSVNIKAEKKLVLMYKVYTNIDDPSTRIRRILVINELKRNHASNIHLLPVSPTTWMDVSLITVPLRPNVVLIHEFGAETNAFLRSNKGLARFVYDYNEDIGHLCAVYETLQLCDSVICCSTALADKVKKDIGKESIVVIPDMYEDEQIHELLRTNKVL